jgi:UDP-glucose 6-dehydrogenase
MAQIAVVGAGYVGLTTAACFSSLGHEVVCADIDEDRIARLARGDVPIVESGLEALVREGLEGGRLRFVVGGANAARSAEFAYLCVPTPQAADGSADLSYIEAAAREIGAVLPSEAVVVNKSTVPVGSTRVVERVLGRDDVLVVSNPEFLREGSAVHDFLNPDRIVIGSDDQSAAVRVASLYIGVTAPIIVTDPASAETIKYASNAFLATKISFVNAIAAVCEAVGADVKDVVLGMGYDRRIGHEFLRPGPGWGGSCFLGHETLLVERSGRVELQRFDRFAVAVGTAGPSGWRVAAWRPGRAGPELWPVGAVTVRPYDGDVVEVGTASGRRVTVTADHPFVVGDGAGGDVHDVRLAGQLTLDDWLPLALGPLDGPRRPGQGGPGHGGPGHGGGRWGSEGAGIPGEHASWRAAGLWLARGDRAARGRGAGLGWTLRPGSEEWLVDELVAHWRSHGVEAAVRREPTAVAVSVPAPVATRWIEALHLGPAPSAEPATRLPDIAWRLPPDRQLALLAGLWWGGGSWSPAGAGGGAALELATGSAELADGVLRLLAGLGIVAEARTRQPARATAGAHVVRIRGDDQVRRCLDLVPPGSRATVLPAARGGAAGAAPPGFRLAAKNTAWSRVTSLGRRRHRGAVYSVEVPGAGTVVTTGGLVAHNCFPKDSRALVHIADAAGYPFDLLRGVISLNEDQFHRVVAKVREMVGGSLAGRTVGVWGLTFKARTDDTRDSPALRVVALLEQEGAAVRAYDPAVKRPVAGVEPAADPYSVCDGADVLAVLTEWDEFRWLDFDKVAGLMRRPRVVDARNLLDRPALVRRGFAYVGIGR